MDTKLATTNIRMQQWAAIFQEKTSSGLTVDEYCDQNGISRNAYYYWLRRIKETALLNSRTTFVELAAAKIEPTAVLPATSEFAHSFVPQLIIEQNGFVIGVCADTPKELLTLALETVLYVK